MIYWKIIPFWVVLGAFPFIVDNIPALISTYLPGSTWNNLDPTSCYLFTIYTSETDLLGDDSFVHDYSFTMYSSSEN